MDGVGQRSHSSIVCLLTAMTDPINTAEIVNHLLNDFSPAYYDHHAVTVKGGTVPIAVSQRQIVETRSLEFNI